MQEASSSRESAEGGTAALLGGTSGQDRHHRSDSVDSLSARNSLHLMGQAPFLRRKSADGRDWDSDVQVVLSGARLLYPARQLPLD